MSHSTTLATLQPQRPRAPHAATLAGIVYETFSSLWPRPPAVSPRITEASAVRRMADRLVYSDPALAAELYAAAGRHERFDEERALR
ncbi:MAG: hypothetical protein IT501_09220 [Rubrivivax sp.]|jgi:hypothetical protein|nr:hypothetical protein [Rubrivivax sp.]